MAWRKNLIGKCHLCGDTTLLTFEHVPPRAAFNDCGVLEADIRRLMGANLRDELTNPRGREKQKGAGGHTLCARCNNDTGAWYADSYVELVKQAYPLAHSLNKDQRAIAIFTIQPLNVLKQILVMFCTACPPDFAAKNPALVRFLLNRECRAFPQDLGVYLGLFDIRRSAAARQSGISARLDAQSGTAHIYSEISFPPFNLVMTVKSGRPDERLRSIVGFRSFDFRQKSEVCVVLENLAVSTYFPADYRSRDELPV